jgi:hypothetical protein
MKGGEMQKRKWLTAVIFSIWGLIALGTSALAMQTDTVSASPSDNQSVMPPDAVGSYTINGEFHWIVPCSDVKIVDFSGMSRDQIFEKIKMPQEEEAKIVHQVPPTAEVIIDGIGYKSEDIHIFDGQQLGFVTGNDGELYAFTSENGLQGFRESQSTKSTSSGDAILSVDSQYTHYYADWYLNGSAINCYYQVSLAALPQGWDNVISSLEVNTSCYATRLYDYADFGGDYFESLAGTTYNVLWTYGWNDRASSTLHY